MTQALLGEILLRVTFWVCVLYPAMSFFWPWWQSAIGITVMVKAMALALVLLPSELHYALGLNTTTDFWRWFALVSFALIPLALAWRVVAIYQAQKRGATTG